MVTRIARPLFAVSLLAALIAPRIADACSPPLGFFVERAWPAEAAEGVPTDGVIVLVGQGWMDTAGDVEIEIKAGDVVIPGVGKFNGDLRYEWRSDAPLAPNTLHTVHIVTASPNAPDEFDTLDLTFTTGPGPAAPPVAGVIASAVAETWEKTLEHCALESHGGDCGFCEEWVVDGVETRMRLALSTAAPDDIFEGFYLARLAVAPTLDALPEATIPRYQSAAGATLDWDFDLGLPGTWPGDQVCFQVKYEDPIGQTVLGEPACLDVSEINVEPPPEETTGEEPETTGEPPEVTTGEEPGTSGEQPETTGEQPETTGDIDSDSAGEDVEIGCGCRSDDGGGWSGLLALLGLGLVRPRRRR